MRHDEMAGRAAPYQRDLASNVKNPWMMIAE
jgi:hypothetical protein